MKEIKLLKRFFRLDISEIAYVKFIIESYEGIAIQRTLNAKRGEIEIMTPDSNADVLDGILLDLKTTIIIEEIKKPIDYLELVL